LTNFGLLGQEILTKNLCCKLVLSRNLDKNVFIAKKSSIKQGLPVRKKTFFTAGFISVLFLIAIAEAGFVKFAQANPYLDYIQVYPPIKPTISISFPEENNTLHNSNKLRIGFNTTIESKTAEVYLWTIYYKASWQRDNITVYQWSGHDPMTPAYSCDLSLTEIPEGKQTVTITVRGEGDYVENMVLYYFYTVGSCTVGFTIDTVPPSVSVLELENRTCIEPDVPLNFVASESVSKASYALDGKEKVTIDGNTTLTGLSNGVHNVTVYAWDAAGNVGSSETITFTTAEPEPETQPEPFPTITVATASVATIAVMGAVLLVYFKKRKR
jgi:hypothetical protein